MAYDTLMVSPAIFENRVRHPIPGMTEDTEINTVMLATALAPRGFLAA